jgi:hypothetical protein
MENYSAYGVSMDSLSEVLSLLKLKEFVSGGFIVNRLALIRQRTHTGHPLVNALLIQSLEQAVQRRLTLATKARTPRKNRYGSKTT